MPQSEPQIYLGWCIQGQNGGGSGLGAARHSKHCHGRCTWLLREAGCTERWLLWARHRRVAHQFIECLPV